MSFFPDVAPGQPFRPSAKRENALSRLLNERIEFSGRVAGGSKISSCLSVYNSGSADIPAGVAVTFDPAKPMIGDAVPAKICDSSAATWGVLTETLSAGEFGAAVVSGPVRVLLSREGSGNFVEPSSDGTGFVFSGSGAAVLGTGKDGERNIAIVVLGGGAGVSLCKIASVPAGGVGAGTAKAITGFSESGEPVLSENDIPVYIPRLL